jgi:hypothetical protein
MRDLEAVPAYGSRAAIAIKHYGPAIATAAAPLIRDISCKDPTLHGAVLTSLLGVAWGEGGRIVNKTEGHRPW